MSPLENHCRKAYPSSEASSCFDGKGWNLLSEPGEVVESRSAAVEGTMQRQDAASFLVEAAAQVAEQMQSVLA